MEVKLILRVDMISGEILKICGPYLHGLHCTVYKQNRLVCLEYRELENNQNRRMFEWHIFSSKFEKQRNLLFFLLQF